jgi:hypothetical protein
MAMRLRSAALVLAVIAPLSLLGPAKASTRPRVVNLVINNFRFCRAAPCGPLDTAYLRNPNGGSLLDNPNAIITVKAGSIIRWTYQDKDPPGCDFIDFGPVNCPGHEVRFENGTAGGGKQIGYMRARTSSPQVITFTVPLRYAGRTIHYFCNINNHWAFGLTGILQITK